MSMPETGLGKPDFKSRLKAGRRAVDLAAGDLVRSYPLRPGSALPLAMEPAGGDVDLAAWTRENRELVGRQLLAHGAILFRGFGLTSVAQFEAFAQALCPELFAEYGDLPQRQGEKVYESTPYPPDKTILFHNEASHTHRWPLRQFFFCVQPARRGGETPIVDCRALYQRLRPELRDELAAKGLMYVRNFIPGIDVSWQEFFRTDDRATVEERCREAAIRFQWREDGGLRTWQLRPAVARHPGSGERVLFNQIPLHHVAFLDPEVRRSVTSVFGEEGLPRNVYFGDGSPIADEVAREIYDVYLRTAVEFPWQKGDVLLLDNMLTAHSRNPFEGPRKIVVAMGDMVEQRDLSTDGRS